MDRQFFTNNRTFEDAMAKSKSGDKAVPTDPNDASAKPESFETAVADLQQIVSDLEDNSLGLEASLAQFERGIGLLRKCQIILDQAEQKIEILVSLKDNGEATTAPFDAAPTAGQPESKSLF